MSYQFSKFSLGALTTTAASLGLLLGYYFSKDRSSSSSYTPTFFSSSSNYVLSKDGLKERVMKLSSENIADACEKLKLGQVINASKSGIKGFTNKRVFGKAYTVTFSSHQDEAVALYSKTRFYLDKVESDSIIVINNLAGTEYSVFGGLLSLFAKHKAIAGLVTNGSIRDIEEIKQNQFPVFAANKTLNRGSPHYKVISEQTPVEISGTSIHPGDYILASSSGIIVLRPEEIERVLSCAEKIVSMEKSISNRMLSGQTLEEIDKSMGAAMLK